MNNRQMGAAIGIAVAVGATIVLHQATAGYGAELGLSPLATLALVAAASYVIPKIAQTR